MASDLPSPSPAFFLLLLLTLAPPLAAGGGVTGNRRSSASKADVPKHGDVVADVRVGEASRDMGASRSFYSPSSQMFDFQSTRKEERTSGCCGSSSSKVQVERSEHALVLRSMSARSSQFVVAHMQGLNSTCKQEQSGAGAGVHPREWSHGVSGQPALDTSTEPWRSTLDDAVAMDPGEQKALLDLKEMWGLTFPNWSNGNPCALWDGITCNGSTVTRLSLTNMGLAGDFPLPLAALTSLEVLELYGNRITGSLGTFISTLANLTLLDLGYNQLSGSIPAEVGNISKLHKLALQQNVLEGSIPESLGSLKQLTYLTLHSNKLMGTIPSVLADAPLEALFLRNNKLTGLIPVALGKLTGLTYLDLSGNYLQGSIPTWFSTLTRLENLIISSNQLTGKVVTPPQATGIYDFSFNFLTFGCPSDLSRIAVGYNCFEGDSPCNIYKSQRSAAECDAFCHTGNEAYNGTCNGLGTCSYLPGLSPYSSTCTCSGRQNMSADCGTVLLPLGPAEEKALLDLKQLWGLNIPSWSAGNLCFYWDGITCNGSTVTRLSLPEKYIQGGLPQSLTVLKSLELLELYRNGITGSLGTFISTLTNLTLLDLGYNKLSGSIPAEVGNMTKLRKFALQQNVLEGSIPETLGLLKRLTYLTLHSNKLTGTIPSILANTPLEALFLRNNRLTGLIPVAFGKLTGLTVLDLSGNYLQGSIPTYFSTLTSLQNLNLRDNQLMGPIIWPPLASGMFDFSYNFLTSGCPDSVEAFPNSKFHSNCLADCKEYSYQKDPSVCDQFCHTGNSAYNGTCNGAGVCSFPKQLGPVFSFCTCSGMPYYQGDCSGPLPSFNAEAKILLSMAQEWGVSFESWVLGVPCAYWEVITCQVDSSGRVPESRVTELSLENLSLLTMPVKLGTLKKLQSLTLTNDKLTGSIPSTLGQAPLTFLNLKGNQLTGSIPFTLGQAPLVSLVLKGNQLTGSIPSTLGQAPLKYLDLSNNQLLGSIPDSFSGLSNLRTLDISNNQLSGSFPARLASVRTLSIWFNFFSTGCQSLEIASFFQPPPPSPPPPRRRWPPPRGPRRPPPQGPRRPPAPTPQAPPPPARRSRYNCFVDCAGASPFSQPLCNEFCYANSSSGPCSGNGICSLTNSPTGLGVCLCNVGFNTASDDYGVCVDKNDGRASGFRSLPVPLISITLSQGQLSSGDSSVPFTFLNAFSRYITFGFFVSNSNPGFVLLSGSFWMAPGNIFTNFKPGSTTPDRGVLVWNTSKDQGNCSACWAQAPVDASSAATVIASNPKNLSVPNLATEQVLFCSKFSKSCASNYPSNALDYLVQRGIGKATSTVITPKSSFRCPKEVSTRPPPKGKASPPGVIMYERVQYRGWFGILLTLMHQPVVVSLDGSYPRFQQPALCETPGYVFSDSLCFSEVTHTVVALGYDLNNRVPYWVIRNSWGRSWCQSGYMRMKIEGGDGICGINVLPGYYPIPRPQARDPCYTKAIRPSASGDAKDLYNKGPLNPCGGGKCYPMPKWGALSYRCNCSEIGDQNPNFRFINVNNTVRPEGSITQTCIPVDACGWSGTNPCVAGSCVNDGKGGYSCMCPPGWVEGRTWQQQPVCMQNATTSSSMYKYDVKPGATCSLLSAAYQLTQSDLLARNPGLICPYPKVGTSLNVNNLAYNCGIMYNVQPSDRTCEDVQAKITPRDDIAPLNVPDIQAINPGIDCSRLFLGQLVCLGPGPSKDYSRCKGRMPIGSMDNCPELLAAYFSGRPLDMFRLNPSIYCDSLVPPGLGSFNAAKENGAFVCTLDPDDSTGQAACGSCCTLGVTRPRDTCTSLLVSPAYRFTSYKQLVDIGGLPCKPTDSKSAPLGSNINFCYPKK